MYCLFSIVSPFFQSCQQVISSLMLKFLPSHVFKLCLCVKRVPKGHFSNTYRNVPLFEHWVCDLGFDSHQAHACPISSAFVLPYMNTALASYESFICPTPYNSLKINIFRQLFLSRIGQSQRNHSQNRPRRRKRRRKCECVYFPIKLSMEKIEKKSYFQSLFFVC